MRNLAVPEIKCISLLLCDHKYIYVYTIQKTHFHASFPTACWEFYVLFLLSKLIPEVSCSPVV